MSQLASDHAHRVVGLYGDPTVSWSILLEARLATPLDPAKARDRLKAAIEEHPHLGAVPDVLTVPAAEFSPARERFAATPYERGEPLIRVAVAWDPADALPLWGTFIGSAASFLGLIDKVRSAKPDFLLLLTSAMPDCKLVLEKLDEFKLGKGKLPLVGNGAPFGSPELLKTIGPELLEGLLFSVANWPLKGQEEFIERFKKRTGEPFATQDALCGYGHTWILKEALESAGAADKLKVADAIRKMNLTTGPAALSFPGPIRFDERGRRQDVPMVFAQWQKGVPVAVYPEDRALAKPFWPSV